MPQHIEEAVQELESQLSQLKSWLPESKAETQNGNAAMKFRGIAKGILQTAKRLQKSVAQNMPQQ
ncbi:MAG TPA: hypothetical protein VGW33_15595 [Terriglobia bacterium]|nr:hypothetical protein [Terriglobia bacterium]